MSQATEQKQSRRSVAAAVGLVRDRLARERRALVQGLRGSSRAAYLAALYRAAPRPLLVLTPSASAAETLAADLHFFLGEEPALSVLKKRVHVMPAWDVSPFAPVSPSPETVAQRIEGLHHLSQTSNPIVVTTAEAALQRVMAPAILK